MHAYVALESSQTVTIQPATPGKVVRLRRFIVPVGSSLRLFSGVVELLPTIGTVGLESRAADLYFPPGAEAPQTPVGGALQLQNLNDGAAGECWVAWEVV